ncbi:hypothetical protein OOZ51_12780 [Arthrobacter sp. MI7-26]|nr:hypothetical protein [Arthrobacter sp. MI7-26]MCX2748681.1 hypothetical protein [Arthrobacter sp. MI7-26]
MMLPKSAACGPGYQPLDGCVRVLGEVDTGAQRASRVPPRCGQRLGVQPRLGHGLDVPVEALLTIRRTGRAYKGNGAVSVMVDQVVGEDPQAFGVLYRDAVQSGLLCRLGQFHYRNPFGDPPQDLDRKSIGEHRQPIHAARDVVDVGLGSAAAALADHQYEATPAAFHFDAALYLVVIKREEAKLLVGVVGEQIPGEERVRIAADAGRASACAVEVVVGEKADCSRFSPGQAPGAGTWQVAEFVCSRHNQFPGGFAHPVRLGEGEGYSRNRDGSALGDVVIVGFLAMATPFPALSLGVCPTVAARGMPGSGNVKKSKRLTD